VEELIKEDASSVRLRMTPRLWSLFEAHRLSFGPRGPANFPFIDMLKSARIEKYADYTNGLILATMGAFSYQMSGEATLTMGRYCSIADHTSVMGERHPVEHITSSTFTYRAPRNSFRWAREELLAGSQVMLSPTIPTQGTPVLQHDVWTGNHVILQRGITLHTGCVVAAGAVVTKDVAPYAIVGGNPARVIRMRFSDKIIEGLLASEWWRYEPSVLFECDIKNPERFLAQFAARQQSFPVFDPPVMTWESLRALLSQ